MVKKIQTLCYRALLLGLETAKCGHVFRLLAGDAPVVRLVDRLVMFPCRFVVDGESLDRLCGECLKLLEIKVNTESDLLRVRGEKLRLKKAVTRM